MELKIYAIKDIKADSFLQPMYFRRSEEAVRSFGEACNDPSSTFYKYAEDYVLYELGTFNDDTGLFQSYPSPISIMSASVSSTSHRDYYAARTLQQKDVA